VRLVIERRSALGLETKLMRKLLWIVVLAIGCGGSAPSPPAIDTSRAITSLTGAERMDYCAWQTATLGGEGHAFECAPLQTTTLSVDSCVKKFANLNPKCDLVTYGNFQACTTLMSKDCSNIAGSDDCLKVFMCALLF
jgi:hypothetical protein